MTDILFVGLDVHKATVAVAVAEGMRGGEVRQVGTIPHRAAAIAKLEERLAEGGRRLSFCYEAGPCGYGLYRQLIALGHDCMVVAPSLIPMKAGDRVKTDRPKIVDGHSLPHRCGDHPIMGSQINDELDAFGASPEAFLPVPKGEAFNPDRFGIWGAGRQKAWDTGRARAHEST